MELRCAAGVLKHYHTFYGDFGDIMKALLVAARRMDRTGWAQTVLLSLQQVLEELLLEHGPDVSGVPGFGALRDLGRRLALHFGPRAQPYRRELLQLHRAGIAFALQGGPGGGPGGAPLHLPFLEVLAEFSPRLLHSDRSLILSHLRSVSCWRWGVTWWPPVLTYTHSLLPPSGDSRQHKRRRTHESWLGSSPPPSPTLTSTVLRDPQRPPPAPPSPQTSGVSSIMEEDDEEEEEVTPPGGLSSSGETPKERLDGLQALFDSDVLSIEV
ncbi:cohesin subunit SA-3, partial [Coturnix japonica]|uniref:cohesin subunit SA-3 n=1 Tax=Coturnix japonica TaxID=93934 RepID=UPI0007771888